MMLRRYVFAFLLALAPPAFADLVTTEALQVQNMSVGEFLDWHDAVKRRAATKEFDALSRTEREQLAAAQAEIRGALDGKESMAELDDAGRLTVFNAHEKVLALVNKAEDERLICTQKKRLGSHRHQLECRTVAQIRESREGGQRELLRTRTCDPRTGCGGN
ncbi:MAG: hypothetical protein LW860_07760 [Xanthomonadaceae bacterium]|jgi:hypothetical protein|nr:hypothetical protein [Xanthomonadaceae bacterium]